MRSRRACATRARFRARTRERVPAQHYLAVDGKGDAVARADVVAVAKKHLIPARSVDAIVDAVTPAVGEFRRYASAYGVTDRTTKTVRRDLDAQLAAIATRPPS